MTDGLAWIRTYYRVPAYLGSRIEYSGGKEPRFGVITGGKDGKLLIRLDGEWVSLPYHPTWRLRYGHEGETHWSGHGATPAIALLIALLQAKEAQSG